MTRGERRAVLRLLDAAVPAGDGLPPARETDAVEAFGAWLRAGPPPNRAALRALLRVAARGDVAGRIESGRGALGGATQLLARIAAHCYYGDERVMRALGYDARSVAARGLALRRAEGRV
ncbi:MAG TPA: hypothetical protein VHF89_14520 [Solirubrobacteraceae bacterium]|nr:hypothetical protein [Solirubrobacteraceae bacterium]